MKYMLFMEQDQYNLLKNQELRAKRKQVRRFFSSPLWERAG